jgi:uncharacterized protein (TIGR02421 family)
MTGKSAFRQHGPPLLARSETTIRTLSDRLVEAQRPIRILDAIKWDDEIERGFFAAGARELPPVTPAYYASRPLPFDPPAKLVELDAIARDIRQHLGDSEAPAGIMLRMCQEYRDVVRMLAARGTPAFSRIAQRLYGRPAEGKAEMDAFRQTVAAWKGTDKREANGEPRIEARDAVGILAERLATYFQGAARVRVKVSDGIVADAAAGGDCIKLRGNAAFTLRDLRILEVHEGWVHLGTTLNGQAQPTCTFLSKGPPSATTTQEGLAVLTEILTGAAHPARLRRLAGRITAVTLAAEGADFLDVYRHFLGQGCEPREGYQHTMRVFRGSLPTGGPFPKDLCYGKGLVQVCRFVQRALSAGKPHWVPLLFAGKTTLADIPALADLMDQARLMPGPFLPPPFVHSQQLGDAISAALERGGPTIKRDSSSDRCALPFHPNG